MRAITLPATTTLSSLHVSLGALCSLPGPWLIKHCVSLSHSDGGSGVVSKVKLRIESSQVCLIFTIPVLGNFTDTS